MRKKTILINKKSNDNTLYIKSSNFPGVKNINKRAEPPREDFQQGKMREGFSSESNHGVMEARLQDQIRSGKGIA